jgi:DNA-directed RNA polymerase specialized sigma subunit
MEVSMSHNPVDEYLEAKSKEAADRDALDMDAYDKWRTNPTRGNMNSLLRRFKSDIDRKAGIWRAEAVNEAAFKADLKKNAIKAIQTYDPTREGAGGRTASLRTHVSNLMRRSQRFNVTHQNVAKIPEDKVALITPIQRAQDQLMQKRDVPPTHNDIAAFLNKNPAMVPVARMRGKITPTLVSTVQRYQIKDIGESQFESDPVPQASSFERETLRLLRHVLPQADRDVYDYLYGSGGKPQIKSTGEIAKRLGRSASSISRAKARIRAEFLKHTGKR